VRELTKKTDTLVKIFIFTQTWGKGQGAFKSSDFWHWFRIAIVEY